MYVLIDFTRRLVFQMTVTSTFSIPTVRLRHVTARFLLRTAVTLVRFRWREGAAESDTRGCLEEEGRRRIYFPSADAAV